MPSPRKASPAHGAEAEMSSKKKVASPAKAAGKAQGEDVYKRQGVHHAIAQKGLACSRG
ncbi:hypothetical protein PMI06_007606 [Burkholderia sp. BT03]|nr:hypothetical protein PMI06_007606 [Burkholderia sp. BT03]